MMENAEETADEATEKKKHRLSIWKVLTPILIALFIIGTGLYAYFMSATAVFRPFDYVPDPVFVGYNGQAQASFNVSDMKSSLSTIVQIGGYRFSGDTYEYTYQAMNRYEGADLQFKPQYKEAGEKWLAANGYDSVMQLVAGYFYNDYQVQNLDVLENGKTDLTKTRLGGYALDIVHDGPIKNGDTVYLHWNFNGKEDEFRELASHLNVKIDTSDKTIKVSGLEDNPYVFSRADVEGSSVFRDMKISAEENFAEYVADEWDPAERVLDSFEYVDFDLLTNDDYTTAMVVLVYKGVATQAYVDDPIEFYVYYKFPDVEYLSDGRVFANTILEAGNAPYYLWSVEADVVSVPNADKGLRWYLSTGQYFSVESPEDTSPEFVYCSYPGFRTLDELWEYLLPPDE